MTAKAALLDQAAIRACQTTRAWCVPCVQAVRAAQVAACQWEECPMLPAEKEGYVYSQYEWAAARRLLANSGIVEAVRQDTRR